MRSSTRFVMFSLATLWIVGPHPSYAVTRILGKATGDRIECVRYETAPSGTVPTLVRLRETDHFSARVAQPGTLRAPAETCRELLRDRASASALVPNSIEQLSRRTQVISLSKAGSQDTHLQLIAGTLDRNSPDLWRPCAGHFSSTYAGFTQSRSGTSANGDLVPASGAFAAETCRDLRTHTQRETAARCLSAASSMMRGDAQCSASTGQRISRFRDSDQVQQARELCANLERNMVEDIRAKATAGDEDAQVNRLLLESFSCTSVVRALNDGRTHPYACLLHPNANAFASEENSTRRNVFESPRGLINLYGQERANQLWRAIIAQNRACAGATLPASATASDINPCQQRMDGDLNRMIRATTVNAVERQGQMVRQDRSGCAQAQRIHTAATAYLQSSSGVVPQAPSELRNSCPALYQATVGRCYCGREAYAWRAAMFSEDTVPMNDYSAQVETLRQARASIPDRDSDSYAYRAWKSQIDSYMSRHGGALGSDIGCEQFTANDVPAAAATPRARSSARAR